MIRGRVRGSARRLLLLTASLAACNGESQQPFAVTAESVLSAARNASWNSRLTPFDVEGSGACAANLNGQFVRGEQVGLRIFLGTDGTAGRLEMRFADQCKGGETAFVIKTAAEGWGPLAGAVLIEFFTGTKLRDSIDATLLADRENSFSLKPGVHFDRVLVTNTAPDPPGVNDDATVTLDNAWCLRGK